jgi:hypothetical protein
MFTQSLINLIFFTDTDQVQQPVAGAAYVIPPEQFAQQQQLQLQQQQQQQFYPAQTPSPMPYQQNPGMGYPQNPGMAYPQGGMAYPPAGPAYPPGNMAYPPGNMAYPPGNMAYPPAGMGYTSDAGAGYPVGGNPPPYPGLAESQPMQYQPTTEKVAYQTQPAYNPNY